MQSRQALSTLAVVSLLVLSALATGATGSAVASTESGNTPFADQPTAYQTGGGPSDATVSEGDSVTVDVPVTDETIDPASAYGENWTHQDAPETITDNDRAWSTDAAVGDRFVEGRVNLSGEQTIDTVTVETGGNISSLYVYLGDLNHSDSVAVTDGTATLTVDNASTDEILFFEKDEETTKPLTVVDVRASNDGNALDRTEWSAEMMTMENIDVSEALDGDDDPWVSPEPMSVRTYAITKVFDGDEERIDAVTVEHDGQNYPSGFGLSLLSEGSDLSKTVSTTSETTTIDFEPTSARTVMLSETDDASSNSWAVTDLRFHRASTKTVQSVQVDATKLGQGLIEAERGENGEFTATFTPAYSSLPDGNYTLPVIATDADGNEYQTETTTIEVDTEAPAFPAQPSASDAEGDWTVTDDEKVTVTADLQTTEPTVQRVTADHTNVSSAPEAMDGDETPWTSDKTIGDRSYEVVVQFDSERTVDEIEIETSGTSSPLSGDLGSYTRELTVTDGTARMQLDSGESVDSFSVWETDTDSSNQWTISDLNAYHDGQQLDESAWSVEVEATKTRDVTSTFEDESSTWSARSPVDANQVWFTLGLAERSTVDELTIEHVDGAIPSYLYVFTGGEAPSLTGVGTPESTTRIDLPTVQTETIVVYEDADSGETDWAVSDLSISGPDNDDVETVTVDASPLGAGTVEATEVGPNTYEATIDPDSGIDGSYKLDVSATDEAGNVETTQTNVITVDTADSGSNSGGSPGGSGSSGGSPSTGGSSGTTTTGGGAIPADTTDRPEMVVDTATANGTTNVSITHARTDSDVSIEVNGSTRPTADEAATGEALVLEDVRATVASDGNYSLTITEDESLPDGAERFGGSDAESPIGYVQVDHDENETFEDVTFEYRVSASELADRDLEPGEVVLYRHSDGEWTTLETSVVSQNDTWVTYEADSPGFSTFAVGAEPSASISVTDAAVETTAVSPGGDVVVEASVENDGGAEGASVIELTLDGERELTDEVSLDAGETATLTFETSIDEAGQYAVAVNGTSAGTLSVGAETSSPTPTEAVTTVAEHDADGVSLLPVGVGVLVLLGALGAFRYVRA